MRKIHLFIFSLLLFVLASCQNVDDLIPEKPPVAPIDTLDTTKLTLSEDILVFSHTGGTKTFDVETQGKWTITEIPQWLTLSASQGEDSTSITVTVQAGTLTDIRNVKLVVKAGELTKRLEVWQDYEHKQITINVPQAGTLAALLDKQDAGSVIDLKLTGQVNYKDLMTLRNLNRLLKLDMKDVSIVEGERHTGVKWVVSPPNMIDDTAFVHFTNVESVILPTKVTRIGKQAFAECQNIKSVSLPSALTVIDEGAFSLCVNLPSIAIPNSVIELNANAFADCHNLEAVTLPSEITGIAAETFLRCSILKNINIHKNIHTINTRAFAYCTSLTTFDFGRTEGYIGDEAFYGCSKLYSITVPQFPPKKEGAEIDRNARITGSRVFLNCTSLREIYSPYINPPFITCPHQVGYIFDAEYMDVCYLYVPIGATEAYRNVPYTSSGYEWNYYKFREIIEKKF